MSKLLKVIKERNRLSIKRYILKIFMVGMVLFLVAFILSNIFSYQELKRQVTDSNENTVKLYMNQIDNELDRLERNLCDFLINDDDMMLFNSSIDTDHNILTVQSISNKLSQMNSLFDEFDGLFVYNTGNKILVNQNRSGTSANEKLYVSEYIMKMVWSEDEKFYKLWYPVKIYGRYYFIRCIKDDRNYVGAFVRADVFLNNLNSIIGNKMNYVFFADTKGKPLTKDESQFQENIKTTNAMEEYGISSSPTMYIAISVPSEKGEFYLVGLLLKSDLFSGLNRIILLTVILGMSIIGLILAALKSFNSRITKPVGELIHSMKQIESGTLAEPMEIAEGFKEFNIIKQSFNEMVNQIEQLKIDVYEEKISKQKAELHFLQLQANPHFYMNSFNVIYSLAATKNYDLIKTLVLALAKHSRYILKANSQIVRIKDELEFIDNYIEVQRIRYYYELQFYKEIEEELLDYYMPPLIIQTFIENSIKYALINNGTMGIIMMKILKEYKNNLEYIHIVIEDNGPGYPLEILESIYKTETYIDAEGMEHYGIANALHRFWLMYHIENGIQLSNRTEGGARTDIWIPIETKTKGGIKHESNHC